ncbi:MAG: SRPBCC family protein [Candidatus Aquicultor sp.]|nr:SRPBCC family protein [Candidatus Aquicultor sp.]
MPLIEETINVRMSATELFPIISDFEKYPDMMADVKKVTILERGEGYTVSEWINEIDGRVIKWVEKDLIKPEENRIDFEQVKGDLKMFQGYWQLDEASDETKITFSILFEFGIPMLAPLLHPLLSKKLRENMKQMLADIKIKAEGQAVGAVE